MLTLFRAMTFYSVTKKLDLNVMDIEQKQNEKPACYIKCILYCSDNVNKFLVWFSHSADLLRLVVSLCTGSGGL